ncbi:MAG: hypothetical protein KC584_09175, partial [Nitrospira sp.]|nr:hypothetical protein [Nitrospira sp.]
DPIGSRRTFKAAPSGIIQNRAEQAGSVEIRLAEPIDRPVHADQCSRLHISDQAVIFDGLIGHCYKRVNLVIRESRIAERLFCLPYQKIQDMSEKNEPAPGITRVHV